jgi:hypothetical protein
MMGLDMTMPGDVTFGSGDSFFGGNLTAYVQNGTSTSSALITTELPQAKLMRQTVPESRVDDMATRILAAWHLLGQDKDYPAVNFNAFNIHDPLTVHSIFLMTLLATLLTLYIRRMNM